MRPYWRRQSWRTGPWGRPKSVDASILVSVPAEEEDEDGLSGWFISPQVFLKYYHVELLNLMVQQATQRVVLLQAYIRGWLGARRYRHTLTERERSALVLQSGQWSSRWWRPPGPDSNPGSLCAAYRGHKVRRKVQDDKTKAKFEAFVVRFQAGENKLIISQGVAPPLILLFSLQELSGQKGLQGAAGGEEQGSNQNPGPLQRPQGAEKLPEEKVKDRKQHFYLPVFPDVAACFREEQQREREEKALKEKEKITKEEEQKAAGEEEETKAAVVLQSNYRGFKERKKLKERKKTIAGDDGQEMTSNQDEPLKTAESQGDNEEEEESTYKAEDDEDSDHTQVPEDEELVEMAEDVLEVGLISLEEELKAATVLQSNFRGHKERKRLQEEGKIPVRRTQRPLQEAAGESCSNDVADVTAVEVSLEDQEEAKAAVVLQSNFRGRKERKRLEEEGKIPKKKRKEEDEKELPQEDGFLPRLEEEKAATVLQSNFRGHRERKKLKEEREMKEKTRETEESEQYALDLSHVVLERRDEADAEKERLEEEQAAVKIQSHFRGFKGRKNLKANKEAAELQAEQLENFSKQVRLHRQRSAQRAQSSPPPLFPAGLQDVPGLCGPAAEAERHHPGASIEPREPRHVCERKRHEWLRSPQSQTT